jgi:hypothetical protein
MPEAERNVESTALIEDGFRRGDRLSAQRRKPPAESWAA